MGHREPGPTDSRASFAGDDGGFAAGGDDERFAAAQRRSVAVQDAHAPGRVYGVPMTQLTTPPQIGPPKPNGPQGFSARYDHIIDFMIANSTATLREIAACVGYSYNWTSLVTNSDAFKARYEMRRLETSERLDHAVVGKLQEATVRSLDIVLSRLQEKRHVIPLAEALDASDTLLQRMGYGVKQGPGTTVNVQQNAVPLGATASPEEVARAREKLRKAENVRAIETAAEAQVIETQPLTALPAREA